MDYESIKTVAAFGGFALGFANLSVTVYEKFLRKGILALEVSTAFVRRIGPGQYAIQMEIALHSKGTKNWIKSLKLSHNRPVIARSRYSLQNTQRVERDLEISKALTHSGDDYLAPPESVIPSDIGSELQSYGIAIKDLGLDVHERKTLEILEIITTEHFSDGWEDFPLKGWSLCVDNGYKVTRCPFEFTLYPNSYQIEVSRRHVAEGFTSR